MPTIGTHGSTGKHARRLQGDDRASSLLLGFLVAAGIFLMAMAAVVSLTNSTADDATDPSMDLDAKAREVLSLVVTRPGATTSDDPNWEDAPETLHRFGLGQAGRPMVLDYDKVQKLRDSNVTASKDNGKVDYPEVLEALDLNGSYNMHLRTYPVFLSVDDAEWTKDKGIHGAYLAHGESGVSGNGAATYAWSNGTNHVTLEGTVTNTGGSPAVLKVSFILDEADGDNVLVDDQYTRLLADGASDTVRFRLHQVSDWPASEYNITARLIGPYGNTLEEDFFDPVDLSGNEGGSTDWNLVADAASNHAVGGENLTLYLDHVLPNGKRIKNSGLDANLSVVAPNGTEVVNKTVHLPKNQPLEWSCDATRCADTGNYTVALMAPDTGARRVTDHAYVSDSELFTQTKTPTGEAQYEMGLLEDLLANFDNSTYSESNPEGDVYVDSQGSVEDMVGNLDTYDLLVVGSNVEHSVMTDANTKYAIRDWVHDGGHLVVLGTAQQNTQWLQPLYGSGTSTATGGISTPDPTHPILQTPEDLAYTTYDDNGTAWKLKDEEYYTHVIAKDGDGQQTEDTLAVSKPGAFGNGSVVLTSYVPSDLTNTEDPDEPLKLLHNLASHSYNMVFIDYGPIIPEGADVGSAERVSLVPHPSLPEAQVEVRVVIYVWR